MGSRQSAWWRAGVWVFALCACSGSGGHSAGMTAANAMPATGLPCEVSAILQLYCVRCHGSVLSHGAPLSLLQASDFQAAREGSTVGLIVLDRVRNPLKRMPPPPDPELGDADVATLRAFVEGGALAIANGCAVIEAPMMPGTITMMPGTTTMMPGTTTMTPDGDDGGAGATPGGGSTGSTQPSADWNMFGYDLTNSRNNAGEHTLSPDNVKSLHKVWEWKGAATTSTPAVVDGVVYLPAWDGKVYALHAEDGSPVWTATLPNLIDASPSVGPDLIFVADNMGWVHAITRADGTVKWSTQVDKHAQAHVWSSPAFIADPGIVVVGVGSGEEAEAEPYNFRGSVVALDAQSGMVKWQFFTTDNDQTSGPGIAVWASVAVDTARKVLYVGTGNNYATPSGPYADSMLAIDYTTGHLVWSHQFTMNDTFTLAGANGPDFDLGSSASLFSIDGQDLIGVGIKDGQYFVLDRDSGAIKRMVPLTEGSVLGGVISASAYVDGVAFTASNRYTEGLTDTVGIDVREGKVLWRQTAPMITYGAVVHANGVLYVATTAGTVFALDGGSGAVLWSADAPDSIAGGPSVANGLLFVPWGYQWTLGRGEAGMGGMMVFGL